MEHVDLEVPTKRWHLSNRVETEGFDYTAYFINDMAGVSHEGRIRVFGNKKLAKHIVEFLNSKDCKYKDKPIGVDDRKRP